VARFGRTDSCYGSQFISRQHADIRAAFTAGCGGTVAAIEVKHVAGKRNRTYVLRKSMVAHLTTCNAAWEDISEQQAFTQLAVTDLVSFGHHVPGGSERLCTVLVLCATMYLCLLGGGIGLPVRASVWLQTSVHRTHTPVPYLSGIRSPATRPHPICGCTVPTGEVFQVVPADSMNERSASAQGDNSPMCALLSRRAGPDDFN
jgi:hypothetical protein